MKMKGSLKTMKTTKTFASLFLCAALLAGLCACGGNKQAQGATANEGTNTINQIIGNGSDSKDYLLSEYLASGETIWFKIDENEGKDSSVSRIYLLEDDGTMYYMRGDSYKLGELEQMEDADIAAMVKDEYTASIVESVTESLMSQLDEETSALEEDRFTEYMCDDLSHWVAELRYDESLDEETVLSDYAEEDQAAMREIFSAFSKYNYKPIGSKALYTGYYADGLCMLITAAICNHTEIESEEFDTEELAEIESIRSSIETTLKDMRERKLKELEGKKAETEEALATINTSPAQYKLALVTDSTGNNTAEEVLAYQYPDYSSETGYSVASMSLTYLYPVTELDGSFGNCNMVVYDSRYGGYFVGNDCLFTRMQNNVHFQLDDAVSAKLPIDVDINTLFENTVE